MPIVDDAPRRFSVAPMMERTDRHCRFFLRLLSRHARLYTEMIAAQSIVHGDRDALLGFDPREQPLALQVGGSEPRQMAECARIAEQRGYLEVNINAGCPSDRVRSGRFGACLMAEPERVAACVRQMRARVGIPITVKTRIGIDRQHGYAPLRRFVSEVRDAGCNTFIVHARNAWLSGLSPKENREVPPLRPQLVYRLKADFPDLEVVINGGITDLDGCRAHLRRVDGVMLGREPYRNPWLLTGVERALFGAPAAPLERADVVGQMVDYARGASARGVPLHRITRHMLGLFHGMPGARAWRRALSERAAGPDAEAEVLLWALERVARAEEASRAAA